jgi:DNA-binding transcriptional MerR regulator
VDRLAIKYVTISKAASLIGEKTYLLKEWENEFPEFLSIKRDEKSNTRLLTSQNIETLRKIKSFKDSNMDVQTIKQLLQNQTVERTNVKTAIVENEVKDIKESLSKITAFIESSDVQKMLKIDARLKEIEQNVVFSVSHQINETAKLQTEVARIEFADVQEMISNLSVHSEAEREMYKEEIETERKVLKREIHREREFIKRQTDDREERFLAFVKQHQDRQERIKLEQRSGFSFIKQMIGFAK